MILKVSPTRVNLLNLKKELKTASRGHKLLKDKRDGLMRVFMQTIKQTRQLRDEVQLKLDTAFGSYVRASAMTPTSVMESAFMLPNAQVSLDVATKSVMSVKVPEFTVSKEGSALSYGFLDTTGDLDTAIGAFDDSFVDIIRLAQLEKTVEKLAEEIERTRRRVSALEHVRIPNLKDTVGFIKMQLEERNRDSVVATMRVKAMIEAKAT